MSLDKSVKEQLVQYLDLLEEPILFRLCVDDSNDSIKVKEFIEEIAAMSDKITIKEDQLKLTPSFTVDRLDYETGITFAGVPLGHEFTSFVLAILQVSGRPPVISDEQKTRILSIKKTHSFTTYVSLTCQNCPDIVQSLNIMSILNPNISHTMIEGGMYQNLIKENDIKAVPTVYLDDKEFAVGRKTMDDLLDLIAGPLDASKFEKIDPFDVLIIGGGPAGASAAIYAARKGIRTGLVASEFGGQVLETLGIENFIGTPYIEGPKLMAQFKEHVKKYDIELLEGQKVTDIDSLETVEVTLENGAKLLSTTVIIATGARWRLLNIPGETEFKNKGVSYCPHCDGPIFEGQDIVVIGGGNSGIEAAIDLSYLAKSVTILEFMGELKADEVLQKRLSERENTKVILNANTIEISGENHVKGVKYIDRKTEQEHYIEAQGVFPLIGLVPNTDFAKDKVDMTLSGEIIVDKKGATSLEGVFAAGDCTDCAYKQIVISVGSGATAALGAFDYIMRKGK